MGGPLPQDFTMLLLEQLLNGLQYSALLFLLASGPVSYTHLTLPTKA